MAETKLPKPPWTNKYKENWDDAYQRMMAWWEGYSIDHPLILTSVPTPDAPSFKPPSDPKTPERRDLDEDYCLTRNRHWLESRLFLAESAPAASTGYGSLLCMLAAMAGSKVRYTPETGTAWIEKIESLYERPLPEFSEDCLPYAFAIRMIHRHAEEFGFDCILGANVMLDPLTTLSMMRGPGELCMDLLDNPEMVKRWCKRLGDLFIDIVSGYRTARAQHGRREDMNWTGIWAPGDMDALQCDFSTMLSPDMFNEFVKPELEREAEFFDFALWHLDGTDEIRHLDAICSVKGIRAIQWVDERSAGQIAYLDLFKKIRKLKRSLTLSCRSVDEAVELTKQLGKDGLALQVGGISSEKEMDIALKRLSTI